MLGFLLRRLALALVTGFAVLTLVFFVVRVLPGNPAHVILGDFASRAAVEALEKRLGLDLPIWQQYLDFMGRALRGDWGASMLTNRPVIDEILRVLPWTIELTVAALVIGVAIGIPLGVWAAVRRNRGSDYVIRVVSLLGLSFPAFVSAVLLLLVLAIQLRWFPVISAQSGSLAAWAQSLALPALNLGLINAAYITRVTRGSMLEVLQQDYVRTARAKGLRESVVVMRHAFRNALIPIATVLGFEVGALLTGAFIVEAVFAYPGVGMLAITSLTSRDFPVIQGIVIFTAFIYVAVNIVVDLLYAVLDPRVRY